MSMLNKVKVPKHEVKVCKNAPCKPVAGLQSTLKVSIAKLLTNGHPLRYCSQRTRSSNMIMYFQGLI